MPCVSDIFAEWVKAESIIGKQDAELEDRARARFEETFLCALLRWSAASDSGLPPGGHVWHPCKKGRSLADRVVEDRYQAPFPY